MSVITIRPRSGHVQPVARQLDGRNCGADDPGAACEIDWLASKTHEADLDIEQFTRFSLEQGWGDGLPLIPPTEGRVRAFLGANDRFPDEVIGYLPPSRAAATVEKIVINAVMAGAPAASLELLIAAVAAIAEPDFELYGINCTTAPVFPAFVVNGPVRHDLDIPFAHGCFAVV